MSDEINLLNQRRQVALEQRGVKILRIFSAVVSVVTILVLGGILVLKISSPLPQLKSQESNLLAQLDMLAPKTAKLLFIQDRLRDATSIVTTRPAYDKTIDFLASPLPDTVEVETLKIDTKSVTFIARSSSLSLIHTFLNYMVDEGGKRPEFKRISLSDLSFDGQSGKYNFTMTIESI